MLIETRVQPSHIDGLGLFAVKFVPRGTPVWTFQAGFDHNFPPEQFAALPELARQHVRHFCFVSKLDGHVILSGDHACFINHSTNPNTGAPPGGTGFQPVVSGVPPETGGRTLRAAVTDKSESFKRAKSGGTPDSTGGTPVPPGPPVVTVALRDIAAGEEFTCNYFDYDADTRWKLGLVAKDAPLGA